MMDYEQERAILNTMGLNEPLHFTEEGYQMAVGGMENEDGTKGPHFSLEDVKKIIEKKDLGEYNIYDYAYVLNMVYSDYYGAIDDKDEKYEKLADLFIFDKDGPKGKPLKYYMAMKGLDIWR